MPALIDGIHPIPADEARTLTHALPSFATLFTHPADGAVLPAIAKSYTITTGMRRALIAAWVWCSYPGCSRPAKNCELDHKTPFDHDHPDHGGPTSFDNLHPLCKHHHQDKTHGLIRMRINPGTGVHEWLLPLRPADADGLAKTLEAYPPPNPLEVEHAHALQDYLSECQEIEMWEDPDPAPF